MAFKSSSNSQPRFRFLFLPLVPILILLASLQLTACDQDSCISDPSNPSCSSFKLPDDTIKNDIAGLCKSMPYMSGCSINDACNKKKDPSSDKFCQPFSILADICQKDMPTMQDCANYVSLCNTTSVVEQCKAHPAIPSLPTTDKVSALVTSICKEMPMDGCELCPLRPGETYPNCDIMKVYGKLCKAMPDMSQCPTWKDMCKHDLKDWGEFCYADGAGSDGGSSNDDGPPIMRMYFHQSIKDYVLFQFWVPYTLLQYILSVVAVFVLSVFHEFMGAYRTMLENRWKKKCASQDCICIQDMLQVPFPASIEAKRGLYHFVEMTLGYALMLIAMTFNYGIFFAVMLGFGFGKFLFGHLQGEKRQSCC